MEVFRFVVIWSQIILSTCLENLAFNKSATQSSNLHDNKWLAEAAVDGNGNQVLTGNSCACTGYYKPTVWPKVDLGNVYALSNVKIFYRNEGTLFRLTGLKLYVTLEDNFISSSPVYVNNNGDQVVPYLPANFTVTVATYGQYVTLYKDRTTSCDSRFGNTNFCALFELCEVEVLGCPQKKYGTTCLSDCPADCLFDVCAVNDGKCYGCKAGYRGDTCNQPCGSGTYGIGCSQTCSGNCKGGITCDVGNGTCLSGCSDGYQGTYCNKSCSPGTYGPSCSFTCGSCRNNDTCNHINGSCPNGCALGVTGKYCKTACSYGKYGYNCIESCSGNCLNGVTCNVQTGYCNDGCVAGWKGDKCDTVCNKGTYGRNCLNKCTGNCANETTCSRINGACQYGCKSGWKGNICNQACKDGEYGPGCTGKCGNCINDTICDRRTGACAHGCADGFKEIMCQDECNIGYYGQNCLLKCSKCNATCDHVTGECQDVKILNSVNCIQDLKLPFIIYGVLSSVIICFSTALNIWLLRQKMSLGSENKIRTNDFEFSLSKKSGPKDNSGNLSKIKSGNTTKISSCSSQESITPKYEELGPIRAEKSNYEILRKGEGSVHPQQRETKDPCNRLVKNDVGTDDKNYEKLLAGHAENSYESLRDDGISEYANA